jgi:hypothetical protein
VEDPDLCLVDDDDDDDEFIGDIPFQADVVGSGSAEAQTDIEHQIAIAQAYNSPVDTVNARAAPKASSITTAVSLNVINTLSDGSWASRMEHEIELSFRGNYQARNMVVRNEGRTAGLGVGSRGEATKDGPVGKEATLRKTGAPLETSRERKRRELKESALVAVTHIDPSAMGIEDYLLGLCVIREYYGLPTRMQGEEERAVVKPFLDRVRDVVGPIDLTRDNPTEVSGRFVDPIKTMAREKDEAAALAEKGEAATDELDHTVEEQRVAFEASWIRDLDAKMFSQCDSGALSMLNNLNAPSRSVLRKYMEKKIKGARKEMEQAIESVREKKQRYAKNAAQGTVKAFGKDTAETSSGIGVGTEKAREPDQHQNNSDHATKEAVAQGQAHDPPIQETLTTQSKRKAEDDVDAGREIKKAAPIPVPKTTGDHDQDRHAKIWEPMLLGNRRKSGSAMETINYLTNARFVLQELGKLKGVPVTVIEAAIKGLQAGKLKDGEALRAML